MWRFLALCCSGSSRSSQRKQTLKEKKTKKNDSVAIRHSAYRERSRKSKARLLLQPFVTAIKQCGLIGSGTAKSPTGVTGERENLISFPLSTAFYCNYAGERLRPRCCGGCLFARLKGLKHFASCRVHPPPGRVKDGGFYL